VPHLSGGVVAPLKSDTVRVDDLTLHYFSAGEGQPVLLLHGWPTSALLWRNVTPAIAKQRRVLALDLPGFGGSDKPLDRRYDFAFFRRAIDGFLAALGITSQIGLVVHDLGGPVGLNWASQNPQRVERLALLNTLVYPELSLYVKAFMLACKTPGLKSMLSSRDGLKRALYLGIADRSRLRKDVLPGLLEPFKTQPARDAMLRAACQMDPDGLRDVASWLRNAGIPVRIIYGAKDRILPDIAKTVERVKRDVPNAEVTVFERSGHFLQEEEPEELGRLLAEFFATPAAVDGPPWAAAPEEPDEARSNVK
jgi:pimeloyl-ACP methyl ester carboxylesterase